MKFLCGFIVVGLLLACQKDSLRSGVLNHAQKNPEQLARQFVQAVAQQDTVSLAQLVMDPQEAHDYQLAQQGDNPSAAKFMGMLMGGENRKVILEWLQKYKPFKKIQHVWVQGPTEKVVLNGYEEWRGFEIFAVSGQDTVALPFFRTLVRSADGFKIHVILEPGRSLDD